MRKGLTENIDVIIDRVSTLECIRPYYLAGGTALAMQLGHRLSEDLDFMMWRVSKTIKPQVDWPVIKSELEEKVGKVENMNLLGLDQVEFVVAGVKFSFFVSDSKCPIELPINYLGNIRLADVYAILAMKIEVMMRRSKLRDYYDIYSILQEEYDISKGIEIARKYSQYSLQTKNILMLLLSDRFDSDQNFEQLEPKYKPSREDMREYILNKLKHAGLK